MTVLEAYKMTKEQLSQRKRFKEVCDECVPQEYIDLDEFVLEVLELLTDHCIESVSDLYKALDELENYQSEEELED